MNRVNRLRNAGLFVVALALVAAARLTAQTTQAPVTSPQTTPPKSQVDAALPLARSIIDRHIEAIGGRAAILARTSTRAAGTVSIPSAGMTGSVEVYAAKPGKTLMRITLAALGVVEEGFDGTNGWSLSPMTGPALMQGRELDQKRFDADFYADLHSDERYQSMATVEKAVFDGRPCYKVSLVRRGGGEDFEFYDVATGLRAGGITTRDTPMGPVTGTTVEGGYRKFGALLQPTAITQTAMGVQQIITLTTVEYDSVAASTFDPPSAIKALLK